MDIIFDPAKDAINVAKHGISLSRAADIELVAVIESRRRDDGETRYRTFGFVEGRAHCLVFVVRDDAVRAISCVGRI